MFFLLENVVVSRPYFYLDLYLSELCSLMRNGAVVAIVLSSAASSVELDTLPCVPAGRGTLCACERHHRHLLCITTWTCLAFVEKLWAEKKSQREETQSEKTASLLPSPEVGGVCVVKSQQLAGRDDLEWEGLAMCQRLCAWWPLHPDTLTQSWYGRPPAWTGHIEVISTRGSRLCLNVL